MRRSPLKRTAGLKRTARPKARPKPKMTAAERGAAKAWHMAIVALPCAMCVIAPPSQAERQAYGPELRHKEAHHVISKQHLKAHGLRQLLWDLRNGLCLCSWHHARETSSMQSVPASVLTPAHHEFAADAGLAWLLEREYA